MCQQNDRKQFTGYSRLNFKMFLKNQLTMKSSLITAYYSLGILLGVSCWLIRPDCVDAAGCLWHPSINTDRDRQPDDSEFKGWLCANTHNTVLARWWLLCEGQQPAVLYINPASVYFHYFLVSAAARIRVAWCVFSLAPFVSLNDPIHYALVLLSTVEITFFRMSHKLFTYTGNINA